jgi:hypothetical protein
LASSSRPVRRRHASSALVSGERHAPKLAGALTPGQSRACPFAVEYNRLAFVTVKPQRNGFGNKLLQKIRNQVKLGP